MSSAGPSPAQSAHPLPARARPGLVSPRPASPAAPVAATPETENMIFACTRARKVLISLHEAPVELHVAVERLCRQLAMGCPGLLCGHTAQGVACARVRSTERLCRNPSFKVLHLFTLLSYHFFIETEYLTRICIFGYLCLPESEEGIDWLPLNPSDISNKVKPYTELST